MCALAHGIRAQELHSTISCAANPVIHTGCWGGMSCDRRVWFERRSRSSWARENCQPNSNCCCKEPSLEPLVHRRMRGGAHQAHQRIRGGAYQPSRSSVAWTCPQDRSDQESPRTSKLSQSLDAKLRQALDFIGDVEESIRQKGAGLPSIVLESGRLNHSARANSFRL